MYNTSFKMSDACFITFSKLYSFMLIWNENSYKIPYVIVLGRTVWIRGDDCLLFQGYLVAGYYFVCGEDYDISWATPHCVLTLRLTGVVYDLYDGQQKKV